MLLFWCYIPPIFALLPTNKQTHAPKLVFISRVVKLCVSCSSHCFSIFIYWAWVSWWGDMIKDWQCSCCMGSYCMQAATVHDGSSGSTQWRTAWWYFQFVISNYWTFVRAHVYILSILFSGHLNDVSIPKTNSMV